MLVGVGKEVKELMRQKVREGAVGEQRGGAKEGSRKAAGWDPAGRG